MKMMISHLMKVEVKEFSSEGKTLEYMPPQHRIPQRRGKPRNNKEVGET
jgi:hypothetical protein